jgi:hypothetical protein
LFKYLKLKNGKYMKRIIVTENVISLFVLMLLLMLFNLEPAQATSNKAIEINKLIASDTEMSEQFGNAVSISGNRAIVGSHFHYEDGDRVGAAYIYEWDGNNWLETAKLLSDTPVIDSFFGKSVSLSGTVAVVGSPRDTNAVVSNTGAIYIFEYDGNNWNQVERLFASDKQTGDEFGTSVSISGTRILAGAPKDDDSSAQSGSAYIFDYDGMDWNETIKLNASDPEENDFFAWSVSLDGNRAVIGAYQDDIPLGTTNSGSAYVFDLSVGSWSQTQKLVAVDGLDDSRFGYSVSLSNDRVIIGASNDDEQGDRAGAAYIYDYSQNTWSQSIKLAASDAAAHDFFGWSVSLSGDKAVVGAWGTDDNGTNSGSAYSFYNNNGAWTESEILKPDDGGINDQFGAAVALDGEITIIGSFKDDGIDSSSAFDSGAAYVFNIDVFPEAVADLVTISEDAVDFALVLMINDSNIDGGPMTIDSVTQPSHGTVINFGNYVLITTTPNYCNTVANYDSFTYTLNGGSTATVDVSVACIDDAPVSVNDTKTIIEDSGNIDIQVLDNDTDIDAGLKTISSVAQPANGTVVNNLSSLSYQPGFNYCNNGITTDDFSYTLNGGSTASVAVTVTCVDDSPQATTDSLTITEDANSTLINVLDNDTDVDGGVMVISSISQPQHGTVVNNTSSLSYQPHADYCYDGITLDSFNYSLNGGSSTDVLVTVTCVNDAPSFVDLGDIDATELISISNMNLIVNDFAFNFDYGPSNESAQNVSQFNTQVISDSFAILNSIEVNNDGVLNVSFNANYGTAIIQLTMQDDGGIANNGVDESVVHEFSITVTDHIFISGFEEINESVETNKSLPIDIEYLGHYLTIYDKPESQKNKLLINSWVDEILRLELIEFD